MKGVKYNSVDFSKNIVICGIYKITNIVNNKIYIGQSKDIYKRWKSHIYLSTKGKQAIYCAMRKYGLDNFLFSIEEICSPELLDEKEKFFINKYNSQITNSGYNMTEGGQSCGYTFLQKPVQAKKDKEVLYFSSVSDAARYFNVSISAISRCCKGKGRTIKGYAWNFIDENKEPIPKNYSDTRRLVFYQDEKIKKIFPTIQEAAQELKIKRDILSAICYKEIENPFNFILYFSDEEGKERDINLLKRDKPISTSKPIKAINESTLEVSYYKSAREAALILGIDNSAIRKCCNGKLKHYKGYLWQNITMEEYNENINRLR